MEVSLPEMGNMAEGVRFGEIIKVSVYFSLWPLLFLPSLLTYLVSFILLLIMFFFLLVSMS